MTNMSYDDNALYVVSGAEGAERNSREQMNQSVDDGNRAALFFKIAKM